MDTLGDRVKRTIAGHLKLSVPDLSDQARFVEDLKATSLDIIEMIMTLEDAFEVEISDTDAEQMHTVGDVVAFIKAKRQD